MDITTKIYMDNASSSQMDKRVFEAMKPYFFDIYAIATSDFGYSMGIAAKESLEKARETIANSINADNNEIIFTSGFTESNNLAIKGLAYAQKDKNHIITSSIEDFSVLNTMKFLQKEGFNIEFIKPDNKGNIDIKAIENAINDKTFLISIQHANQEIGTVQDIEKIGNIAKENSIVFHVDATHSYMRLPINVKKYNIDLLSIDASLIHGPRGIGALYKNKRIKIRQLLNGGYQENGLRAGFNNIPGAIGFAEAVKLITDEENKTLIQLRDKLINRILNEIPDTVLNGPKTNRLPQNANITFNFIEGESITLHLDMRGIAVSTGSACFSKSLEASHVILGIGGDHVRAHGSLRMTISRFNNEKQIDTVVDSLKEIVETLRKISPLKKE